MKYCYWQNIMQASRLIKYITCQTVPMTFHSANYKNVRNMYTPSKYFLKRMPHLSLKNEFRFAAMAQPQITKCECHTESKVSFFNLFVLKRTFSRTSFALCKREDDTEQDEEYLLDFDEDEDETIFEKWNRELLPVTGRHSVFVIQPYIKWGSNKKRNTSPDLQLEEAVALVQSLHGWKVVDKMMIGLRSFEKKIFFGSGNFEILTKKVHGDERITAVFISTKMLWIAQHRELKDAFGVPVFDRYTLIIHLFRQHAISREAKLQVSMAEIPYMWSRLKSRDEGTIDKRGGTGGGVYGMGGGGETFIAIQKQVLAHRENKIKRALEKLRNHRKLLRLKRKKLEYPIVAVVGYTNAGKTSLIKALTGDESMQPKNQLFATLDVSTHMGMLPSRMKVLYVDTVGFISDIPTNLLESFVATLEDALLADVILHVADVSHPDRVAQAENVKQTLQNLQLSPDLLKSIINVGNKIDIVNSDIPTVDDTEIRVSAKSYTGLNLLKKRIEETILQVTGRTSLIIRVPMGGQETSWLYKEATVTDTEADPNNSQFLLMHVLITNAQLSRFKHFIRNH